MHGATIKINVSCLLFYCSNNLMDLYVKLFCHFSFSDKNE